MPIPLSCLKFLKTCINCAVFSHLSFEEHSKHISPKELFWCVHRPLLLSFTLQVGGTVRGGRLRDQSHPSSLLCGASGVRPPAGTPPLQLCRSLPQIQTSLPLQGLPPRPGGAVQRLSIMTGRIEDRHERIRHRLAGEMAATGQKGCRAVTNYLMVQRGSFPPKTVNLG